MGVFRFILGVLGVLLVIGAFSSFIPLFFLGGMVTGSVGFAFGFPIFLMIVGAGMVYFGFYYHNSRHNSNSQLKGIAFWGIVHSIAIFLSVYILNKLIIVDTLLVTLLTAGIVSVVAQIVRSHHSHFNFKWFAFYFLVYANVIWFMNMHVMPEFNSQSSLLFPLVIGFTLAGIVVVIQRLSLNSSSILWISIILIILLVVANLESFQELSFQPVREQLSNSSNILEDKEDCPIAISGVLNRSLSEKAIKPESISSSLNKAVNTSIWKIDGTVRACYKGKYKGQYPDWYYCDDMIVSRWETSSSGTIKHRWYSAVTAEWHPDEEGYIFDGFSCENGKAVAVDKEESSIYVHDSKDGTVINVHISRDGTETRIDY